MRISKGNVLLGCIPLCIFVILVTTHQKLEGTFSGLALEEEHELYAEIPPVPALTDKEGKTRKRLNVLMMLTDDMRPQLGCYAGKDFACPSKQEKMYTPNLDFLASRSLLLKRAYIQYSLCGPSRASMLTSRRPDTIRIYDNMNYWRYFGGNFTTLPQHFKQQGYHSIGLGKVYHDWESSDIQDPLSWSEPYYFPPYTDIEYYPLDHLASGYKAVTKYQRETLKPLMDEYSMTHLHQRLTEIAPEAKSGEKPFFIALGFSKPHLNFVCPVEHFSHYKLEKKAKYLLEKSWQTPVVSKYCNMSHVSINSDGTKIITDYGLRHLRQAYFACISFVDEMVGQVLSELDTLGLSDSTIVVFVADHGYHFGENGLWGKQTTYDIATHIPMMIRVPGRTDQGVVTRSLVEAVDLYPTIVEAAGLEPIPKCPPGSSNIAVCTEGESFLPLVENPGNPIKSAAYTQVRHGQFMKYAIRTNRHKYSAFAKIKRTANKNDAYTFTNLWDHNEFWTELYDLNSDPEERYNISKSGQFRTEEQQLDRKLRLFFTGAINVPIGPNKTSSKAMFDISLAKYYETH